MKRHVAEGIGDKAVEFLTQSPDLLNGFLNASGITPDDMLAAAEGNAIRLSALHFIAAEEASAKSFSEMMGLRPGQLAHALSLLDPHGSSAW
jgi:hypothetical protein